MVVPCSRRSKNAELNDTFRARIVINSVELRLLLYANEKWKLVMPHYEWPDDDASTVFV